MEAPCPAGPESGAATCNHPGVAPYRYKRRVAYEEFRARVRRHRPSELLPLIAQVALLYADPKDYLKGRYRVVTPWALGLAAKESILWGNENRSSGVSDKDILEICAAFASLTDPVARHDGSAESKAASFFVRAGNEQFGFQISVSEEIGRVQAMFGTGLESVPTEVITPSVLTELMGCSVQDYLGIGLLLMVSAQQNAGYFDQAWLDAPNFEEVRSEIPADTIRRAFDRHFATDFDDFRSRANPIPGATSVSLRRYEFNPLAARPFVLMPDGRYLAPQPGYVIQRSSPSAIYYLGTDQLGDPFTRDVGELFQAYIGRQLNQLLDAEIHPEIVYDDKKRSVDWFAVWDDVVVLIEVKSARLRQGARMGLDDLSSNLEGSVGRAYRQIERTAKLIEDGHPAFAHIPTDRPIVSLFVAMEPMWMVNTPLVQDLIATPKPRVPVMTVASRELEHLIAIGLDESAGVLLLGIMQDPERITWNLGSAIRTGSVRKNPLLEEAWDQLPWSDKPAAQSVVVDESA